MQQQIERRKAGATPNRGRVLLIDYDEALSEVMAALLESEGVEVFQHNCPPDACLCREQLSSLQPDLVLINVTESAYPQPENRGWRCLQKMADLAPVLGGVVVGYTIFDDLILRELGLDPGAMPVPLYREVSNPATLTSQVSARLATKKAA